jgi:hypothetical protein
MVMLVKKAKAEVVTVEKAMTEVILEEYLKLKVKGMLKAKGILKATKMLKAKLTLKANAAEVMDTEQVTLI